jgi:hypothetical protein
MNSKTANSEATMAIVRHQCLPLAPAAWHQELHGFFIHRKLLPGFLHPQEGGQAGISSSTGRLFPYFLIHMKQKKKKKKSFPGFLHPEEAGHNRISSSVGRLL